jgi:hypothetical protein
MYRWWCASFDFENGKMVRSSGFEPPRYCYRQPLKLVRLPVPPRPHRGENFIVAAPEKTSKTRNAAFGSGSPDEVPLHKLD